MKEEDDIHFFTIKVDADGWKNDRANRNIASSDHCLLENHET